MCFILDSNHLEAKIATEDMVCYKIFNDVTIPGQFSSIYQAHQYDKGARFNDEYKIEPCGIYIEKGIHSYVNPAVQHPNYPKGNLNKWVDAIQVKCIIPKGTVYYLNEKHDGATYTDNLATYVSESIIVGTDEDIIPTIVSEPNTKL